VAVSVLVVASAVVVAVQDEKAEKGETVHYNILRSGEGVGRSRPTAATTIVIPNRRQLSSGLKSLQFWKTKPLVCCFWLLSCCNFMFFPAVCR